MLRTPKSRLASAVAVAAAVCALGATTAASAAPAPSGPWSGRVGPVPRAFTDATPAMTTVSFPHSPNFRTLVAWKGQAGKHVFYEYSPAGGHAWSRLAGIPGAKTSAAPSVASYTDPNGREAVLAAWKGRGGSRIFYSQGETLGNGTVRWTAAAMLPASRYTTTGTAPTVFFPAHSYKAVIAYKGPFNHIRYIIGTPRHRGFAWSNSHWIAPNAVASSSAGIGELQSGTSRGQIFVFWKGYRTGQVFFSSTPDPITVAKGLTWSAVAPLAGSVTSAAPAASAVGPHGTGPLLLVYKGLGSVHVLYRTLAGITWSAPALVPSTQTTYGPALLRGILATTSPTSAGNIFFHDYG